MAVLVGFVPHDLSPKRHKEWYKLLEAVRNNQPEFINEWADATPGRLNIGQNTKAVIKRFCIKLGQALYYLHNDEIFEGEISSAHVNLSRIDRDPAFLTNLLGLTPQIIRPNRNSRSLTDQFIYRFNCNKELGALYAVAQFGPQLIFQILAVRQELADRLTNELLTEGVSGPLGVTVRCTLRDN